MARPPSLSKLSTDELHAELRRRQKSLGGLHRKRKQLLARLASVEAQIESLGDSVSGSGRRGGSGGRRARNDVSLPKALQSVLKGKTMSAAEAAEAVQKAGFKSNSKNFRVMVAIAFSKHKDLFKRVGRGQYTAK
jgi:hypothetical protein